AGRTLIQRDHPPAGLPLRCSREGRRRTSYSSSAGPASFWTGSNHGTGAPQSKEKLLVVASGLIGASRDGDFDRASFPAPAERLPTKSPSCGPAPCKFERGRTRGLFCRWPHGGDDCPTRPAPTHPAGRNRANLNRKL